MGWEELEFGCYSCSSFRDKCRLITICPNKEVPQVNEGAALPFWILLIWAPVWAKYYSSKNDSTSNPNSQPCPELNNEIFFFFLLHSTTMSAEPQAVLKQILYEYVLKYVFSFINRYRKLRSYSLPMFPCARPEFYNEGRQQLRAGVFLFIYFFKSLSIMTIHFECQWIQAAMNLEFLLRTWWYLQWWTTRKKVSCCAHFLTGNWSFLPIWGVRQALLSTHSHAAKYLIWCETTHSNIYNYESMLYLFIQLSKSCQARLRLTWLFVPLIYLWDSQSGSNVAWINKEKTHKWRYSQNLDRLPCL